MTYPLSFAFCTTNICIRSCATFLNSFLRCEVVVVVLSGLILFRGIYCTVYLTCTPPRQTAVIWHKFLDVTVYVGKCQVDACLLEITRLISTMDEPTCTNWPELLRYYWHKQLIQARTHRSSGHRLEPLLFAMGYSVLSHPLQGQTGLMAKHRQTFLIWTMIGESRRTARIVFRERDLGAVFHQQGRRIKL